MKYCTNCGTSHNDIAVFCTKCGKKFNRASNELINDKTQDTDSFLKHVYDYVGCDKNVKVDWRVLFSNAFREHTEEEAERIFVCGTSYTTPDPSRVLNDFPRPWLYVRIFLWLFFAFVLLWVGSSAFNNVKSLPGTIVVGSFIVPLSTTMLFFEMNVWRNISIYNVLKTFMIGGCASIVASLILFSLLPVGKLNFVGAFLGALIEEVGKAVIVLFYIIRIKRPTILNGMLYGACVGAGFAAFESAGYAFTGLMSDGLTDMYKTIFLRAFLAPGGHVAWAAISGAAIVIACKNLKNVSISNIITNSSFLRLFSLPVLMHTLWNSPLARTILPEIFGLHIMLIIFVWFILLLLINLGLKEIPVKK